MKKIRCLLFGAILTFACAGSVETSTDTGETSATSEAISQCLANKDYQYNELLTKADVAKYVDIDESSFKENISRTEGKYGYCTYSWASERPKIERTILGRDVEIPDNNQVTIKLLDFYTDNDLENYEKGSAIELFDQGYKKLSPSEYDKLLANMAEKLGDKQKELERAKKMLDSRMNFQYKPIHDLGDRAYWKWSDYGIELVVLIGKARFTIESKTTGEPETSLDHAIHFAQEVLAKCEA